MNILTVKGSKWWLPLELRERSQSLVKFEKLSLKLQGFVRLHE